MTNKDTSYASLADTRRALQALYREDHEINEKQMLLHLFEDGLTPVDSRGRWRPSKLLVTCAGILLAALCVFTYFCF